MIITCSLPMFVVLRRFTLLFTMLGEQYYLGWVGRILKCDCVYLFNVLVPVEPHAYTVYAHVAHVVFVSVCEWFCYCIIQVLNIL